MAISPIIEDNPLDMDQKEISEQLHLAISEDILYKMERFKKALKAMQDITIHSPLDEALFALNIIKQEVRKIEKTQLETAAGEVRGLQAEFGRIPKERLEDHDDDEAYTLRKKIFKTCLAAIGCDQGLRNIMRASLETVLRGQTSSKIDEHIQEVIEEFLYSSWNCTWL